MTDKAEQAESETIVQLEVIRALKPLSQRRRLKVLIALKHIMLADEAVPGIMEALSAVSASETQTPAARPA